MRALDTPFTKLINEMEERKADLVHENAHKAHDSLLPYRERRFGILLLERLIERTREMEKAFVDEPEEEND